MRFHETIHFGLKLCGTFFMRLEGILVDNIIVSSTTRFSKILGSVIAEGLVPKMASPI